MRFFELDIDEDQVRRLVKTIIDLYEEARYASGSYEQSVKETQERTVQTLEDSAELVIVPMNGTLH